MKKIKYLVMDVDGTLTDGKIYMGENGESCKVFHVKDGYGIHDVLPKYGITPIIITGRNSKILERRCMELGISRLYQGISDKEDILEKVLHEMGGTYSEVAYIGDDLNDYACMNKVRCNGGIVGCPADAIKKIIQVSDFVALRAGGNGAVREFIEYIIG